jgi:pimeloyl-ACP methyl ester carboxylesterase
VEAAPIILVPGFWLGAWAWDEVGHLLRADGHDVSAMTLPGLESADTDRSGISLNDHVEAIADAVRGAGRPAVLAVHSGAGASGYAASDRVPELVAEMVYVDSGPPSGALDADLQGDEEPMLSPEELAREENLDGLTEEQLDTFQRRAVPEPAGPIRDAPDLKNDARLDVPTTVICTGFTSEQVKGAVEQGLTWIAALAELRSVTYVDLPTSHWPMWSRPKELARIIGDVAQAHAVPDSMTPLA